MNVRANQHRRAGARSHQPHDLYADKGHVAVHDPARRQIVRFPAGDLTARQADTGDAGPVVDATQVPEPGGAGHWGGTGT